MKTLFIKVINTMNNMKVRFLFKSIVCLTFICTNLSIHSQTREEITLTVTADGSTKDDAIKNALRLAIEQSYGAFVSANTTILNDDLVKDEIIAVTNGTIKNYNELTTTHLSDGRYETTLTTTVSVPELISYARNKGSECEFAGNEFGLNVRLFEIEKQNELKALYNMIPYLVELAKNSMEWNLVVHEPKLIDFKYKKGEEGKYYATGQISSSVYHSDHSYSYFEFNDNISWLLNKPLDGEEYEKDEGTLSIMDKMPSGQYVVIKFDIVWEPNNIEYKNIKEESRWSEEEEILNNNPVIAELRRNLKSLLLDWETVRHLGDLGYNITHFRSSLLAGYDDSYFSYFRNSPKDVYVWFDRLLTELNNIKNNFVIVDNTGQISDFSPVKLANLMDWRYYRGSGNFESINFLTNEEKNALEAELMDGIITKKYGGDAPKFLGHFSLGRETQYSISDKIKKFNWSVSGSGRWNFTCLGGTGIFSNLFFIKAPSRYEGKIFTCYGSDWEIYVLLPLSEISKYSSFKIESKNN